MHTNTVTVRPGVTAKRCVRRKGDLYSTVILRGDILTDLILQPAHLRDRITQVLVQIDIIHVVHLYFTADAPLNQPLPMPPLSIVTKVPSGFVTTTSSPLL